MWKIFILLSLDQFWNIHRRYWITAGKSILIDQINYNWKRLVLLHTNMLHKFGFNIQGDRLGEIQHQGEVKKICMFYKLNVGNSPEETQKHTIPRYLRCYYYYQVRSQSIYAKVELIKKVLGSNKTKGTKHDQIIRYQHC